MLVFALIIEQFLTNCDENGRNILLIISGDANEHHTRVYDRGRDFGIQLEEFESQLRQKCRR